MCQCVTLCFHQLPCLLVCVSLDEGDTQPGPRSGLESGSLILLVTPLLLISIHSFLVKWRHWRIEHSRWFCRVIGNVLNVASRHLLKKNVTSYFKLKNVLDLTDVHLPDATTVLAQRVFSIFRLSWIWGSASSYNDKNIKTDLTFSVNHRF